MGAARKYVTYITPPGTAVWPKLDKPDVYQPKKGDPKIRYTCNMSFDEAVMERVKADIWNLIQEHQMDIGENKNSPFKTDKKGNETLFAFTGKDHKPLIVDSRNKKLPDSVVVGGGSTIRLDITINPFDGFGGGVNFYINAVQVLNLVEKGAFGEARFEQAEGGFQYEESEDKQEGNFPQEQAETGAPKTWGKPQPQSRKDLDDEIPF